MGPVLLSVELDESKENVAKRLEFIESEIKKLDTGIGIYYYYIYLYYNII